MAGNWDIRRIYLYLVSFATLMMMIVGTVQVLQGVINLAYPEPGPSSYEMRMKYPDPQQTPKLSEAEIQAQAEQEQARQHYYQIRTIINNFVLLIVALPVYLYHWRKIQRSETEARVEAANSAKGSG